MTYPTPTDLTEQIDTYTSAERSYVTVTGFFNGSTVSVADDAKYSVSALDIPEEMGLAKLNGHNITVSGYYAGLAEPVHRIIVTTIVDKGAVETVYWTEDFEWLEPWAIAGDNKGKQAGQTVEKDDLDAYCPQLPTSIVDGVSTLQALEAKGYEFLPRMGSKQGRRRMYPSSEELSQIRQNRLSGRYRFVEYRRRSRRGKDNLLVRLVSDATR